MFLLLILSFFEESGNTLKYKSIDSIGNTYHVYEKELQIFPGGKSTFKNYKVDLSGYSLWYLLEDSKSKVYVEMVDLENNLILCWIFDHKSGQIKEIDLIEHYELKGVELDRIE